MDQNNAHVDQRGLYHYHGTSKALARQGKGTLIGYAADGFEIHYLGKAKKSSYQLKKGTRPSAPGGRYDGTYNQDWHYVAGSGALDRCNGGSLNGKFVYFATDTYPFFPRCLWGTISEDFTHGRTAGRGQGGQPPQGRPSGPGRPGSFANQQGEQGPQGGQSGHSRLILVHQGQQQGFGQQGQRRQANAECAQSARWSLWSLHPKRCRLVRPSERDQACSIRTPRGANSCLEPAIRRRMDRQPACHRAIGHQGVDVDGIGSSGLP